MELASKPDVVAAARRHAVEQCNGLDGRRRSDLALVVSELVTNAIRHGGDPVTLSVAPHDDAIRVEVTDGNATMVQPSVPAELEPGGRGLWLVASLCRTWGWHEVDGGKCVWCEI